MGLNIDAYYCEENQVEVVLANDKFHLSPDRNYVVIGYAGVDGIEFQIKNNSEDKTVFAFYPIEEEHIEIAKDAADLVIKWKNGEIIL
ncbi:MAG: hypothetical protein IAF38_16495 [Bacteroidia bacterium]|nr:hypothetical protein [Bacteroidia bacterium]